MVWLRTRLPKARATLVLPLPGGPDRNMDVPEFRAGPSRWNVLSELTSCDRICRMVRVVTVNRPLFCRRIDSLYTSNGTGAGPAYWLRSSASRACRLPAPVIPYVYAPSPKPPWEDLTSISFSC